MLSVTSREELQVKKKTVMKKQDGEYNIQPKPKVQITKKKNASSKNANNTGLGVKESSR